MLRPTGLARAVILGSEFRLKLKFRTDWQSASLSVLDTPLMPVSRFYFPWELRVSLCGAPSLARGIVSNLLLVLGSCHSRVQVPQKFWLYFTVLFENSQTLRSRSPYLYPLGKRWPSYTPGHWVTSSPASKSKSKLKLHHDRQSVGQPLLVSGTGLNTPKPISQFFKDSSGFVDLGRPLWREDESVI
jgi:hypothetical protein